MSKTPNLVPALDWIHHIALECRFDSVEADPVMAAAHKRNIFRVRPAKRHRRAGRATAFHPAIRQIIGVPDLFGNHAALIRKIFHRHDERFRIASGSQFVMAALPR